jgi:recombinational DNA repair ATPase RecF
MTGPAERPSRKPPETRTAATPSQTTNDLGPLHAGERKLLLAAQAAGYAMLRRSTHGLAGRAASRARAEIATEFAHRWAEIRHAPAALRAAMAAALEAEQAAMLSTRTRTILEQLHHQHRTEHNQLRSLYGAQRKALTTRHRQASASTKRPQQGRKGTCPAARMSLDY